MSLQQTQQFKGGIKAGSLPTANGRIIAGFNSIAIIIIVVVASVRETKMTKCIEKKR